MKYRIMVRSYFDHANRVTPAVRHVYPWADYFDIGEAVAHLDILKCTGADFGWPSDYWLEPI